EPVPGPIYLNPATGPTMHLAQTIRDPRGEPLGVVVATLVLAKTLNPIILDSTGLGQTGEAYLVDAGKVMLTPSRFMDHPDPLTHTMDTEGIRRALTGSDGTGGYKGYDGRRVIGAWTYMPEHEWALIVEMKAEEALAPLARMRRDTILVAMLTFGVILMVVGLISRSISAPIRELAAASLDVSRGDLERTVTVRLRDELGELAERFNAMVGSLKDSRSALQDAYDKLVRAQKQIVQAERLAAVGELAASVVHEIRNPLSAVKMNLRILEGKCAQDSVAAEHFRLAREQTERLETMLEDLLDFSKPVALRLAAVRVEDVVEDALRMFRADDAMHTVTVNVSDSLPPLNADRERLGQVLLNLLLNARQASAAGEEIRVAAESVSENGASAIRISVADRGQGIAPENLSHVFEPFFTTRKRGTGLGLANARKIVEIHGGTISIESTVGKGTAVFVTLPIAS
ncbi:HAMP domain-containing protein, partial [bacterium]|nr:HAMP domain-containing protein [bacterium]